MSEDAPDDHWVLHDGQGFLGLVGPVLERRESSKIALAFTAEDKHHNQRGVVQGGMLMTLADRAMGVNARAALDDQPVATVQLDTHFVRAGEIGDFIIADVEILRVTRSLVFMDARVRADERLLVSARGIWKRMRSPA